MSVLDQYASSIQIGRMTPGVLDSYVKPRVRRTTKPATLYIHGAGGDAAEAVGGGGLEGVRTLLRSLSLGGFNITAPTVTQLWGNTTCQSRMNDALTWNKTNLGSTADPVVIIGASHGGACALRYISDNPGSVACAILIIPLIDMEEARTNNTLGLRSAIDAAWGVTYPAALPVGVNPMQNTADYIETPLQIWYAPDDTVCPAATTTAFATATGAEIHSVGNLGHSNNAIAAIDANQVLTFINSNI